jgi:hypothetical protein
LGRIGLCRCRGRILVPRGVVGVCFKNETSVIEMTENQIVEVCKVNGLFILYLNEVNL